MSLEALWGAEFRRPPWDHQLREFEISADLPARALLWQMRTGKTKLVIDTACHLYKSGKIDAVVVIAPNGVHRNWVVREVPAHCWLSIPHACITWDARTASTTRAKSRADESACRDWWDNFKHSLTEKRLIFYAFSSVSLIRDDVRRALKHLVEKRRCLLVFDEATDFRTPGSKRTKFARALAKRAPYRRILEGTSLTNSPLHAFSQFELLQPGALGCATFGEFKMRYGCWIPNGNFRGMRLVGFQRTDELRERIARWSSCVLRGDCTDLPDVIEFTRAVELTQAQKALYREVTAGASSLSVAGERANITAGVAKITKLQQIVSGFLIDEAGKLREVEGGNPRLDALLDEVELTGGKCIIWCQFQHDLDTVVAALRRAGRNPVEYHGRTSAADKAKNLKAFQESDDVTDFVSQPQAGARGLELSAASKIIGYSHTFDAILREQANERATKMGGENIEMVNLVAPGIDEYILKRVREKVTLADDIAGRGLQAVLAEVAL